MHNYKEKKAMYKWEKLQRKLAQKDKSFRSFDRKVSFMSAMEAQAALENPALAAVAAKATFLAYQARNKEAAALAEKARKALAKKARKCAADLDREVEEMAAEAAAISRAQQLAEALAEKARRENDPRRIAFAAFLRRAEASEKARAEARAAVARPIEEAAAKALLLEGIRAAAPTIRPPAASATAAARMNAEAAAEAARQEAKRITQKRNAASLASLLKEASLLGL